MIGKIGSWQVVLGCGFGLVAALLTAAAVPDQRAPSIPDPQKAERRSSPSTATSPTLKSLTEVVNVPVTVRDEDGQLISNLARKDFSRRKTDARRLSNTFRAHAMFLSPWA